MKYQVWILWGQYDKRLEGYEFKTEGELNAFLQGVDEAQGWNDYQKFDNEEEAQQALADQPEDEDEDEE